MSLSTVKENVRHNITVRTARAAASEAPLMRAQKLKAYSSNAMMFHLLRTAAARINGRMIVVYNLHVPLWINSTVRWRTSHNLKFVNLFWFHYWVWIKKVCSKIEKVIFHYSSKEIKKSLRKLNDTLNKTTYKNCGN